MPCYDPATGEILYSADDTETPSEIPMCAAPTDEVGPVYVPQEPIPAEVASVPYQGMYDGGTGGAPGYANDGNDGAEGRAGYSEADLPPPAPYDVTAVDDSDVTGTLAAAVRAGEVSGFHNAREMVDKILEDANGRPLGTVSVADHGYPGGQQMGDQDINLEALQDPETVAALQQLGASFGPDGRLDLHGCRVGLGPEGEALVRRMAQVSNVPVTAGFPYQRPLIPGYEGSTITCYPPTGTNADGSLEQSCVVDPHPTADAIWGTAD